jgi:IS5 family transposase
VALRDEGAYRGRCRLGAGPHGGGHRRQRRGHYPNGEAAARRGDRRLRRCRLHRGGQAPRTGGPRRVPGLRRGRLWNIAIKRSIIKNLPKALRELAEPVERALSQVRAVVEHPFHIVKNRFHHKKLRYRGLTKNTAQLYTLFALANLVIVKQALLAQPGG